MTTSRPLHVLIAGGGLAGLATAQGLLKSGHTVEVFERDADLNRKQGYYLHINALGGEALRRVPAARTSSSSTSTPRASPTTASSRSCSTQPARRAQLSRRSMGPAAGRPARATPACTAAPCARC